MPEGAAFAQHAGYVRARIPGESLPQLLEVAERPRSAALLEQHALFVPVNGGHSDRVVRGKALEGLADELLDVVEKVAEVHDSGITTQRTTRVQPGRAAGAMSRSATVSGTLRQ